MADHPLIQYVQTARQQGLSNIDILQRLTDAGWHTHEVFEIVLDHIPEFSAGQAEIASASFPTIIAVENVSKHFGKVNALDGVNLQVRQGTITALLGPNGAGKTTLIRILTTLLEPDSGRATVAGFDVVHDAGRLRSAIGLAGQYAAVDETLTGRENLEMVGRLYHLPRRDVKARATELLKEFGLADAEKRPVRTYSGGMRRRLDLAASLMFKPKMLFLDEPTSGLDPQSRFMLWHVIWELAQGGTTVLLTTQYLEEADQLAHEIFVMDRGRVIAQGTADELKARAGGNVLELHLSEIAQAPQAKEALREMGEQEPHFNEDTGMLTVPVSGGAGVLVDAVRKLDTAGVALADVVLRRPSLDDVFLQLTGHEAE